MRYDLLILIVLLVLSLIFNKILYDDTKSLRNSLAIEKGNNLHLTDVIDKLNKTTLELKVDYDKKLKEYYGKISEQEKLLKGKPSDECEDIKRSLDDVLKLNL